MTLQAQSKGTRTVMYCVSVEVGGALVQCGSYPRVVAVVYFARVTV